MQLISLQVTDGGASCAYAALVADKMIISNVTGIEENHMQDKTVVDILDFMGRKIEYKPNTLLIYIYSDGSTEKVFRVE